MKIQKKRRTPTLKDRKPSLILNLLAFRASAGVYIGERGF